MQRKIQAVSLAEAAEASPTLGRLTALARESAERYKAVESLIPAPLRPRIKPGPIEGTSWCLLVEGNAAAAKLRQVLPALMAHLRSRGREITVIRLKVQAGWSR